MTAKLIEVVIMEGIAVVMFVFAWQIGIKGNMELIAGFNPRTTARVKDKDGLRRLIARTCLLVGTGSALMPLLSYLTSDYLRGMTQLIGGYAGFIIGIIGMVILQVRDHIE